MERERGPRLPPDDSPERGVDAESALDKEIEELEAIRQEGEEEPA